MHKVDTPTLTDVRERFVYVTAPLWVPFYYVWQREYLVAFGMLIYMPMIFVGGLFLHSFIVTVNVVSMLLKMCGRRGLWETWSVLAER